MIVHPVPFVIRLLAHGRAGVRAPWLRHGFWDIMIWSTFARIAITAVAYSWTMWWPVPEWLRSLFWPGYSAPWVARQGLDALQQLLALLLVWSVRYVWRRAIWSRPNRYSVNLESGQPGVGGTDRVLSDVAYHLSQDYRRRAASLFSSPVSDSAVNEARNAQIDGAIPILLIDRVRRRSVSVISPSDRREQAESRRHFTEQEDLGVWADWPPRIMAALYIIAALGFIVLGGFTTLSSSYRLTQNTISGGAMLLVGTVWCALAPAGLSPFRISSCIARPGGVSSSAWFRRLEFTPADTILLIEGQWHGLTLITFIRTDGAWKRLTVDQSGLTHLLGCWRLPGPEALPDKLQERPLVR